MGFVAPEKMADADPHGVRVTCRVSPGDYEVIKWAASQRQCTMSEILRSWIGAQAMAMRGVKVTCEAHEAQRAAMAFMAEVQSGMQGLEGLIEAEMEGDRGKSRKAASKKER